MATVNYDIERATPTGVIITWPNLANGDVGQGFESLGYKFSSLVTSGTPGSGVQYVVEVANSIGVPQYVLANFVTASSLNNPQVVNVPGAALIRPSVIAGDGTTNLTFSLVMGVL